MNILDEKGAMYAVVTLQDSDEVMVVPSNWVSLDKRHCYWPPFKSTEKCMEAVQQKPNPETEGKPWEKLRIIFLGEYDTFEKAKEGQKEIKEYEELSNPLKNVLPGIKRQRLDSTQEMSNNQLQPLPPVTPASTSRMSADDKDELLQMLRDIKSTVQENSAMLKKLLKDNTVSEVPSSTSVPPKEVKTSLNLPLRTFEDMERTERELNTTTTRKTYVKYLSGLGGFGNRDVIKNIMQHVLIDDLANEFNWQGRGNKKPFSQLTLADVIREAASKRNVPRVDCETEIKKYLSYTADRLSRKRAREQAGPGLEIPNVLPTLVDDQPDMAWDFFDDI
uniref:Si:dkey-266f7.4 n=1 Tax=Cyprinus carpio carpio TaxID=630221 RepID=A0A9J7XAR2_CYPCA